MPSSTVFAEGPTGPFTAINRYRFELILVFDVVSEAEVTQSITIVGDPLHQHVVILAGGEITAAGLGFADDRFGEIIKCTRVGARTKKF